MSTLDQRVYVSRIPPFDRLSDSDLDRVANSLDIGYFNRGETIITAGSIPEFQYLIVKGLVHEVDAGNVVNIFGEQDNFDARVLLHGKSDNDYVVVEEVICYLLPKHVFLDIASQNQMFAAFFFSGITQRIEALLERDGKRELASFMMAKIRDAYIHPRVMVASDLPIRDAAMVMEAHKATSLLVRRGAEVGIVTDVDFRQHVLIEGVAVDDAIGRIANYQLICMQQDEFLFNALVTMTKNSILHVVIRDGEEYVGVLEQLDLLSYFSDHSRSIVVQIARAQTQEDLARANASVFDLVKTLTAKGVKWRHSAQLVTELSRQIFTKLYAMLAPADLIHNSCLLLLGREGRGEQMLHTEQDNALILRDGFDYPGLNQVTDQLNNALLAFGYPKGSSTVMVTNPQWVKPLGEFKASLMQWFSAGEPADLMNLAIFTDATAVAGDASLLLAAKQFLYEHSGDNAAFYRDFARLAASTATPLGFFDNVIGSWSGDDTDPCLDIRQRGVFPIVHGVRTLALRYQLPQTNTIERIRALQQQGVVNKAMAIGLIEAFAFLSSLRLKAGLAKIAEGDVVDNLVNADSLTKLERDLLTDSFKIVKQFKVFLTQHFQLAGS